MKFIILFTLCFSRLFSQVIFVNELMPAPSGDEPEWVEFRALREPGGDGTDLPGDGRPRPGLPGW